jgi:hypothetical protein
MIVPITEIIATTRVSRLLFRKSVRISCSLSGLEDCGVFLEEFPFDPICNRILSQLIIILTSIIHYLNIYFLTNLEFPHPCIVRTPNPVRAHPCARHVPAIVKRHAITGPRLHRHARPASPRVSAATGGACAVNSPAGFCMKYFQPEFDEKFSRPLLKTVSHDLSRNEVLLLDILHELGVWKDA